MVRTTNTKKVERKKKLPKYWQRTGRTETEQKLCRLPEEQKEMRARENDKTHRWNLFHTQLREIKHELGFDILKSIEKTINKFSEKRPFKVFDLGCGGGTALGQLKKKFGTRIKTIGLVLERTPKEKYLNVDRLIVGNVKNVKPRENYNLIYSFQGAIANTRMKTTALQQAISWLKPGGTAVLDLGELHSQDNRFNEMKTLLMQNGIKDYKFGLLAIYQRSRTKTPGHVLVFTKPVRKLP